MTERHSIFHALTSSTPCLPERRKEDKYSCEPNRLTTDASSYRSDSILQLFEPTKEEHGNYLPVHFLSKLHSALFDIADVPISHYSSRIRSASLKYRLCACSRDSGDTKHSYPISSKNCSSSLFSSTMSSPPTLAK